MTHEILISTTFKKQLTKLEDELKDRVKDTLKKLGEDPYRSRSGVDIKKLSRTDPTKYRLRVGDYRVIYTIEEDNKVIKVIEGFRRGRGYRI